MMPDQEIEALLHPEKHISDFDIDKLRVTVIPSGFPSLDEYLLLKQDKCELIFVGGRPSMGKSAFMFQAALNISKTLPVHVFSLEMDADQIRTRLLAGHLNISLSSILNGTCSATRLEQGKQWLSTLNYVVDDRGGLDIHQICDSAKTVHRERGTKVIVIDYLQLLRSERGHSKDDEIGKITRKLKELAKELKVPIVVGSQLNRGCENRGKETGDFKPCLADLRESGNIEQDADMVLFVHRESRYTGARPGEADIIISKNRNGPVGEVTMHFTEAQTRFIDRSLNPL